MIVPLPAWLLAWHDWCDEFPLLVGEFVSAWWWHPWSPDPSRFLGFVEDQYRRSNTNAQPRSCAKQTSRQARPRSICKAALPDMSEATSLRHGSRRSESPFATLLITYRLTCRSPSSMRCILMIIETIPWRCPSQQQLTNQFQRGLPSQGWTSSS